ncbi:MAG: glycosyltransferase family 4 protein [Anaerolineales bacterium]
MNRVLLVSNSDWYLHNYRRKLLQSLIAEGHEVLALTPPGPYVDDLEAVGVGWHPLPFDRKGMNPFMESNTLLKCFRAYKALRPDLVHHFTMKPVLYGSLASRGSNIPAVVNSVTGLGYLFGGTAFKVRAARRAVRPLFRYGLANPRQVTVFQHGADRQNFLDMRLVSEANTRIIPGSGVDPERFHSRGEPDGEPEILMVSRLLWSKGIGDFVELSRHFRTKGVKVRMRLVGDLDLGNPDAISAEQAEDWQRKGLIEWSGHREDVEQDIGRCSIVVLPTRYREGIPRVLLEAAASEKPVVATDIPGCRDVIYNGRNGYLFTPGDQLGFQEAVQTLLDDAELRRSMGAEGRKLVLERFAEERITEQTLSLYGELLA